MIIVKNKKMIVPVNERFLATTYDSNSGIREFWIDRYTQSETDLSGLTPKLDIMYENGTYDVADLDMTVEEDHIILTLIVTASISSHHGTMFAQIRMTDSGGTVKWASYVAAFYIENAIGAVDHVTYDLSELERMEAKVNEATIRLTTAVNVSINDLTNTVSTFVTNGQADIDDAIADAGEAEDAAYAAAENADAVKNNVLELLAQGAFNGPKGDKGDQGPQGTQGPQGAQGPKGDKGDQGDRGNDGSVILVSGQYSFSVNASGDLILTYDEGTAVPEFYYDETNGDLYLVVEGG